MYCCLLSQTLSPRFPLSPLPAATSPKTNSYPHRSGLKFQTAGHSVFCMMFQVEPSFVVTLLNVFVYLFAFSSFVVLPFVGQTAVVSVLILTSNQLN